MTGIDLRGRFTLTVPEAGTLAGLGRDASYDAFHRGELPGHKVRGRLVVLTVPLLRDFLGWDDALIAQALDIAPESANEAPANGAPLANVRAHAMEPGGGQYDPNDSAA